MAARRHRRVVEAPRRVAPFEKRNADEFRIVEGPLAIAQHQFAQLRLRIYIEQVFAMIEQSAAHFGGIDILVNNAQSFGKEGATTPSPVFVPIQDFDEEILEYTFRSGFMSTLWAIKEEKNNARL